MEITDRTTLGELLALLNANDQVAFEVGEELAVAMFLQRDDEHIETRWRTNWGTKTGQGLARTILSQIQNLAATALREQNLPAG
jgi:hypothetical protein